MIEVTCAACGKAVKVADEHAGRRIRCRGCGQGVSVPGFVPGPAEAAVSASKIDLDPKPDPGMPPLPVPPRPPRRAFVEGFPRGMLALIAIFSGLSVLAAVGGGDGGQAVHTAALMFVIALAGLAASEARP